MFTTPSDGVYVFTWTMHSYIFSQIVVNSQVFTSLTTDSYKVIVANTSTGVIVVSLNRGDVVFIQTPRNSFK